MSMEYDVFVSHASEDKEDIAKPLAEHLRNLGLKVWLDDFVLTIGDSLRRSIDHGLSQSKYGVVILSPAFFAKEWPNKELDGLVAREDRREKVIFSVWHKVSINDIKTYSPTLADKIAVSTSRGIPYVAKQIYEAVVKENHEQLVPSDDQILRQIRIFEHRQDFQGGYRIVNLWLPSCGGVDIAISISDKNFLKDTTNNLSKIRKMIMDSRPSSVELFFDIQVPLNLVSLF